MVQVDTYPSGTESQGHRTHDQAKEQQDRKILLSCYGALISKTKALETRKQGRRLGVSTPSSADVPVGYHAYQIPGSIELPHICPVATMVNSARQQNVLKGPPHWRLLLEKF